MTKQPDPTRALIVAQKALAGLMAEAGFAVPSKSRDEQWDAPNDEAASILGTMLALDLVVLPTAESRADPDPTGQNSYGSAALHVTATPAPDLTLCFEPGCTLPGHVSRVHEAPDGVLVTEERLARALEREIHIDEAHGFPPGFGPQPLAQAILSALREAQD